MARINVKQTMRRLNNVTNAIADNIAWQMPQKRSTRDAIAILNPSLARRKGYTPAFNRAQYKNSSIVSEFNPIKEYKENRKNPFLSAGTAATLGGIGAALGYALNEQNKQQQQSQKQNKLNQKMRDAYVNTSNARLRAKYPNMFASTMDEFNQYSNKKTEDKEANNFRVNYKIENAPKGGPAFAAGIQDLNQKIKNKIHPDKKYYVNDNGAITHIKHKIREMRFSPDNPINKYDFDTMASRLPDDSTDVYEIVRSSVGMPVLRTIYSAKQPPIKVPNATIKDLKSGPSFSPNMSAQDIKNTLQNFFDVSNSVMALEVPLKGKKRYMELQADDPINFQAPNRGSGTAKRMTTKKKTINKNTQPKRMSNISQRYPEYVRLPKLPARESAQKKLLANKNRFFSFVESLHPERLKQTIEYHMMPNKRNEKLRNDMNRTRANNLSLYQKIYQGYLEAKNKGYIK
jgi:hypothetical protein